MCLQTVEKRQKNTNKHALHENVQLLQELQVSQQDGKATARQLESVQAELRDLKAKYKSLEARTRGGANPLSQSKEGSHAWGGAEAAESYSSPRGAVSLAGRVPPSRPSSAYPAAHAANVMRSSWSAAGSSPGSRPGSAVTAGRQGSAVVGGRPGSAVAAASRPTSAYRCGKNAPDYR